MKLIATSLSGLFVTSLILLGHRSALIHHSPWFSTYVDSGSYCGSLNSQSLESWISTLLTVLTQSVLIFLYYVALRPEILKCDKYAKLEETGKEANLFVHSTCMFRTDSRLSPFSLTSSSLSGSAAFFSFFFFLSSSFFFFSLSGRMSSSQARSCCENMRSSSFLTPIRPRICTRRKDKPSLHASDPYSLC